MMTLESMFTKAYYDLDLMNIPEYLKVKYVSLSDDEMELLFKDYFQKNFSFYDNRIYFAGDVLESSHINIYTTPENSKDELCISVYFGGTIKLNIENKLSSFGYFALRQLLEIAEIINRYGGIEKLYIPYAKRLIKL